MRRNSILIIRPLILLTILLFPFGHLTRLQLTSSVALYPHDLLILFANLIFFIPFLTIHKKLPTFPYQGWLISFFAVGLLSLIINYHQFNSQSLIGGLYLLRWLNIALLFPLIYLLKQTKVFTINLKSTLLYLALVFALIGLIQYIFIPDTRFLFLLGWDDHLNRLIGTLFDPAFTGILLLLGLILVETSKKPSLHLSAIFLTTILLTYSRATYLTLVVIFVIISARSRSTKYFLSRFSIALALLFLLPRTQGEGVKLERTYSITSRAQSTTQALSASSNPFLGIGFNNFRQLVKQNSKYPSHTSAPDNSFVFLFATTGIIGTLIYLYWLYQVLQSSSQSSPALFTSTAAIITHSLTNNTLFHPFIMIWFWILLASEATQA